MWLWRKPYGINPDRSSVIGAEVRIRGDIDAAGRLVIYGRVDGDIVHNGHLVIGAGAHCASNIQAVSMEIAGEVHGNVQVQNSLVLLGTGRLYGDSACTSLQIQPGATFSGTNHMAAGMPDLPLTPPAPPPAPARTPEPAPEPAEVRCSPMEEVQPEPVLVSVKAEEPKESPTFYGGFSAPLRH